MRQSIRGFTLLELIVVIAIIGVLSVIILPSFQSALAKSKAARTTAFATSLDKVSESMIGRWDIEEGSGTNVGDTSAVTSSKSNGTFAGSVTWSTDTFSSSSASSISINASGGGNRVDMPGDAFNFVGSQPFSISMWVKPSSTTQVAYARYVSTEGAGGGWCITKDNLSDNLNFGMWNAGTYYGTVSNSLVTAGTWQHIAVVWTGSVVKIYYNGLLDKTSTASVGPTSNSAANLRLGGTSGSVIGLYDNVRIYNTALLSSDIYKMYAMDKAKMFAQR